MTIRNKYLVSFLAWALRYETDKKLVFHWERQIYDDELTHLAFLNQSKEDFVEEAGRFVEDIEMAIEHETNKTGR